MTTKKQQQQFNNSNKNASVYFKSLATNDVVTQVRISRHANYNDSRMTNLQR